MTSFGYWADRVPHGYFLCMVCFEAFTLDHAWTDADGKKWDVCIDCESNRGLKPDEDTR